MPLPIRHLLAGPAVAGLLLLLLVGDGNAQDNRNTGGWGGAVVVVLSFIAAAGGAAAGVKLVSKGKRDEGTMEPTLTQLNNSVKELNEKLTKLEATSEEGIHRLSRTLESKMNLGSKIDTVRIGLETVEQHIVKVEEMVKMAVKKKEDNQIDQDIPVLDKTIENDNSQTKPMIIDTSAIINGSIVHLLEVDSFEELKGRIIIHQCVLNELRGLGNDNSDINRGRQGVAGLENLNELRAKYQDRIDDICYDPGERQKPDEKLLQLTKDNNGIIVTRDRELAQKCREQSLRTINVDALSKALRKENLVGREFEVDLKRQPERYSQKHPEDAVAYVYESRVIVKNASEYIGHRKFIFINHVLKGGTYFAEVRDAQPPTVAPENPLKTPPAP